MDRGARPASSIQALLLRAGCSDGRRDVKGLRGAGPQRKPALWMVRTSQSNIAGRWVITIGASYKFAQPGRLIAILRFLLCQVAIKLV